MPNHKCNFLPFHLSDHYNFTGGHERRKRRKCCCIAAHKIASIDLWGHMLRSVSADKENESWSRSERVSAVKHYHVFLFNRFFLSSPTIFEGESFLGYFFMFSFSFQDLSYTCAKLSSQHVVICFFYDDVKWCEKLIFIFETCHILHVITWGCS